MISVYNNNLDMIMGNFKTEEDFVKFTKCLVPKDIEVSINNGDDAEAYLETHHRHLDVVIR